MQRRTSCRFLFEDLLDLDFDDFFKSVQKMVFDVEIDRYFGKYFGLGLTYDNLTSMYEENTLFCLVN